MFVFVSGQRSSDVITKCDTNNTEENDVEEDNNTNSSSDALDVVATLTNNDNNENNDIGHHQHNGNGIVHDIQEKLVIENDEETFKIDSKSCNGEVSEVNGSNRSSVELKVN